MRCALKCYIGKLLKKEYDIFIHAKKEKYTIFLYIHIILFTLYVIFKNQKIAIL